MVTKEPDRIAEKFSAVERIRIGGLGALAVDAWGTASLLSGCLCVKMPPARVPELVIGRAADGLIASQTADVMLRLAVILEELKLPAPLASPLIAYAMRDFLDQVSPRMPPTSMPSCGRRARSIGDWLKTISARSRQWVRCDRCRKGSDHAPTSDGNQRLGGRVADRYRRTAAGDAGDRVAGRRRLL